MEVDRLIYHCLPNAVYSTGAVWDRNHSLDIQGFAEVAGALPVGKPVSFKGIEIKIVLEEVKNDLYCL